MAPNIKGWGMPRYTELKKWFEQQNWRWLVLSVLIAVTVALLATWSYPSAGELAAPKPLPVAVKVPQSLVAEQKLPADDAVMNKLDERVKELESAQKALYLSWLDGQRKTVDWWLTFLGVVAAVLALGGALIPFLMGRKDRELLEADHKLVKRLLSDAHAAMGEIKAFRDGAEKMSINMEKATQVANHFMPSSQDAKDQAGSSSRPIDQESKQQLERANDELKGKAEKNFTANEHYVRGASLYASGNLQGALASFESAIRAAVNAPVVDQVKYLLAKAIALGRNCKFEESIDVYEEIDRRFGSDTLPKTRELVVMGLRSKGLTLGKQGKFKEAIKVYEEIDRRFGREASPGIREQVSKALNGLGFSQIMLAKESWSDEPLRQSWLLSATPIFERSASMRSSDDRAVILGNLGYALFLAGQVQAARSPTFECLKLGGQKMLDAQRADAKLHRVEPVDTHYEQLLDELWNSLPTSKK